MSITFTFTRPAVEQTIVINSKLVRATLEKVRDHLLDHRINGGGRNLMMERVISQKGSCGMAACIGGWASIFLLGFEDGSASEACTLRSESGSNATEELFRNLLRAMEQGSYRQYNRLHELFYGFERTKDFNNPRIAATAIQRYLDGKKPWPEGTMPDVLRFTRSRKR